MAEVETDVAAVDVSGHRDLSDEIERRTGIRHESPQAFVIQNGVPIWSASHGGITSLAISLALNSDLPPS